MDDILHVLLINKAMSMNLGSIWGHLDREDKDIIVLAINHYGKNHTKSYLYKWAYSEIPDNMLLFLKIKPVYHALKIFKNSNMVAATQEEYDRVCKIISIIDLLLFTPEKE